MSASDLHDWPSTSGSMAIQKVLLGTREISSIVAMKFHPSEVFCMELPVGAEIR